VKYKDFKIFIFKGDDIVSFLKGTGSGTVFISALP
jgi:hypothetical protein